MQIVALENQLEELRSDHFYQRKNSEKFSKLFDGKTLKVLMGERIHNSKKNDKFYSDRSYLSGKKAPTHEEKNLTELGKIIDKSQEELVETIEGIDMVLEAQTNTETEFLEAVDIESGFQGKDLVGVGPSENKAEVWRDTVVSFGVGSGGRSPDTKNLSVYKGQKSTLRNNLTVNTMNTNFQEFSPSS